jgi:hypothetical protein
MPERPNHGAVAQIVPILVLTPAVGEGRAAHPRVRRATVLFEGASLVTAVGVWRALEL